MSRSDSHFRFFCQLLYIFVLFGASGATHAVVVDFEDVAVAAGSATFSNTVNSRGFRFTGIGGSGFGSGLENNVDGAFNDTTHVFSNQASQGLVMRRIDADVFQLNSFDAGEDFDVLGASYARTLTLLGNFLGGGSISTSFDIDGLFDGSGGIEDFQSFSLGPQWRNLTDISFTGSGDGTGSNSFSLDNLDVSRVPEPTTAGLLALALFGTAFAGRQRHN